MAPRQIPLRRKLLYMGVMVVLLLGLCEAGLRFRAWMKYGSAISVRDPMLTYLPEADLYVPTPGYEAKGKNIHIKINSLGFRGDEFSVAKPANTFRIVCLGASTTFSAEVSSNQAVWTHRLQEKLQAAYPDRRIEVINAAVGGYVAADNLRNLKHRVLPLNPDLVIYYEANNEIVWDTQKLAIARGLVGADGGRQPRWVTSLSNLSLAFDLAYKNLAILSRSRQSSAGKIDQIPRELPAHFLGQLDEMRSLLAERKVPLGPVDVHREVPSRSGPRDANCQCRRRVLLHALDEYRRHAGRDGCVQRCTPEIWKPRGPAGCRRSLCDSSGC
jgi:hypothetical protein